MPQPGKSVAVIGAGIVGLSTAIWLQRMGRTVTLVDKEGPGAGASYGNGGILASIAIVPVTTPGLWKKAPGMLLDRKAPLFLKWRYLPKLLPFLKSYLAASRDTNVRKTADAMAQLLHDSPEQHKALAGGTAAEGLIAPNDYVYVYADRTAYEADAYGWDLRRERGFHLTELDGAALAAFDPALTGRFGFGVLSQESAAIRDPGAYIDALYAHFIEQGGTFAKAGVTGFEADADVAQKAETDQDPISADTFVVATGAWSPALTKALGVRVPLESERGYHVEFHQPNIKLKAPLMIAAGKFVLTPMNGRLRAAGVVEFGGLDAPPSKAPFELLRRQVGELFPELTYSHTTEWMGHRPAPADSIPVIGVSPRLKNVYLGYGHHHVGLTGGPKTGRWLAQMITGQAPNADLSAYAPMRPL